jgi:sarcosine oxidase
VYVAGSRSRTDVIVMGLGAVGSAAACALASRGHRVTGFDRWSPPHAFGSTHGESRVTRESAWEGADYVPLVRRANYLWRDLERESGVVEGTFFLRNGGLFAASPGSPFIVDSKASADAHGVPHEVIAATEMRARWPAFEPADDMIGFVDHHAGVLFPEPILRAQHAFARRHGADLHLDEAVESWAADGEGVRVTTARGQYHASRLIICTGAWMPAVLAPLGVELRIERNTLHWIAARAGAPPMDPARFPVLIVSEDGAHATAVFPSIAGAVKLAAHHSRAFTTAGTIDRAISRRDIDQVTRIAQRFIPRAAGEWLRGATCMYTDTPHGHFILDRHPAHAQVVLGSPCNGFGLKFAAATGEALAMLALGEAPPVGVERWSLAAARSAAPPR